MTVRFGTDGVRGRAGEHPCTAVVAMAIGSCAVGLARCNGGAGRVIVGRDTRASGTELASAVGDGITRAGGEALVAGVLPTSGVATALEADLAEVGVMITASHNSAEDNGFKVLGRKGKKLSLEETARVEQMIADEQGVSVPATRFGSTRDVSEEALRVYQRALCRTLSGLDSLEGRRIGLDLANGAVVAMRSWLEANIPAQLFFMGAEEGPPNAGCGSEYPERLLGLIREQSCDAGFCVDGDGDRCRLVTPRGIVDGDALAWLLASGRGVRSLAVTVMSTTALEASLPGVRVVRTDVGDRHLAEALASGKAELGCEESGHVLFPDALPTGDGLVTGFRALMQAFSKAGSVEAAIEAFHPFPRRVTKVRVSRREPLEGILALREARVAGERELGGGGRVFLRYSGTEPVLRVLVEGVDAETVDRVSREVTKVAESTLR